MSYLEYIPDEALVRYVEKVIKALQTAENGVESRPYKNVVDPFSAVIDASFHGLTLADWLRQEKIRQVQKTMQNALGNLHQDLLGEVEGWENLGKGQVIDLRNRDKQIVAEVKNKYNTTKGSQKVGIYDDLTNELEKLEKDERKKYVGYYVEVIPKSKKPYNKPFVPSDNKKKMARMENERIRVIDGYSFYEMATGRPEALKELYIALPRVLADILSGGKLQISKDPLFLELFKKAFK